MAENLKSHGNEISLPLHPKTHTMYSRRDIDHIYNMTHHNIRTSILAISLAYCGCALAQAPATDTATLATQAGTVLPMNVDQLFDLAERNNKTLATSRTSVEIAAQAIEVAEQAKLPDINASASLSYIGNALMSDRNLGNIHGMHTPHLGNSFAVEAQQVVYAGGAIDASIRMAEIGKQQAETAVKLTRNQVRFMVLGQYLDLYKIENRMKVYEQNIALTQQLIDNIREKYNQGVVLKNDITRYELQMENLKLGLTNLHNSRRIINHQLCNTLGLAQGTMIQPDTTIAATAYAKDAENYWQQLSGIGSPLIEQKVNAIQMARQEEVIAKSALLPKVALVASDNWNGPITFEIPPINKNLNIWYVGVGVSYNVSSLFKAKKQIKQRETQTRQAQEALAVQTEQLNNDMQQAFVQYMQTYTEHETQLKSVQLSQQNFDVVQSRYLCQMALVTDMVDASNLLLNAQLQEVDARINIAFAYYRMKYVAGNI